MGTASNGSIRRLLDALEERGWIRRLRGRQQALTVLFAPPVPRSPDGAPLFLVRPGAIR